MAAAARTAATSLALSKAGARRPSASAFMDTAGANAAGVTANVLDPTVTDTAPDIAGVANSRAARATSSALTVVGVVSRTAATGP